MKFEAFNLKKETIRALNDHGYFNATKIQDLTIPKLLKGENVIIKSATGSGKTHSYLVPLINNLNFNGGIEAIIIVPTTELALQTYEFLKEFKEEFTDLSIKTVINGIDLKRSKQNLKTDSQIIIATPSRLSILLEDEEINLSNCHYLILDEIDMLTDNSFFDNIQNIFNKLDNPQVVVLSATIPQFIRDFLIKNLPNDEIISLDDDNKNNITHYFINTKHIDLLESIDIFINKYNPYLLFIFANKKSEVNEIYLHLKKNKIKCGVISGDLSLRERKAMLRRINDNEFQVIVCSDLASRGIDVDDVSDVLSVNIPNNIEFFFHRAGRTARNGKTGNNYTFYNNDSLDKIKQLINLGVNPIYLKISQGDVVIDKNPETVKKKKYVNQELEKEINKATSRIKKKDVKPNYKKKVKIAAEKVKKQYKRKTIKKSIRKQMEERYRNEAKKNG